MMLVGKTVNPNYEQGMQQQNEETKDTLIINELPRYLSEVRAFYELNPTEFNGGIKPSGKLKRVQARYLEGLF